MTHAPVAAVVIAASCLFAGCTSSLFSKSDDMIVAATDKNAPSATQNPRKLEIESAKQNIMSAEVSGPVALLPGLMYGFEPYYNPDLARLRKEYKLDEVIRGEKDDFMRVLKLRHWVHNFIPVDNNSPLSYYSAFDILTAVKAGARGNCAHYQVVLNAVLSAHGIPTRMIYLDVDYTKHPEGRHHAVNEVWVNSLFKWVVIDAKYDVHFERNGAPLSAMDIHEAARTGKTEGIVHAMGLERKKPAGDSGWHSSIDSYYWVGYVMRSNFFTQPHWYMQNDCSTRLMVLDTPAVRASEWPRYARDGNLVYEKDPAQINWTPNTPKLFSIRQTRDDTVSLRVLSATPNFKEYRIRRDGGKWASMPDKNGGHEWRLHPGKNTLDLRARNHWNSDGPIVTLTVEVK